MAGQVLDKPFSGNCPACNEKSLTLFFGEDSLPQNSCLLMDDPESAANFPRGKLELGHCDSCGFVSNTAFKPGSAEYSQRYEETQGFSAKFMQFAKELAEQWVRDYELKDKTVLEIGSVSYTHLTLPTKA